MSDTVGSPIGKNIFCWQLFDAGPGAYLIGNTGSSTKQYLLEATDKGMNVSALAEDPDHLMPEIMNMFCSMAFEHLTKGNQK